MINCHENILSMLESKETFKISFNSCCSLSQVTSCPTQAASIILQLLPFLRFSLKEMFYFLSVRLKGLLQGCSTGRDTECIEPSL